MSLVITKNKKKASIVFLDIETSPLTGYAWQTYDTSILKVLEPSKIISVAWKDLSDKEVTVKAISDYKGYKPGVIDDKRLVEEVWKVLDEADVVIAHHGDAFDLKKLNARFVYHGLSAPSSYKSVDTKKVASRFFKFDSNSLNNLGSYLGVGQKIVNGGFSLWVDCIAGDKEAWGRMKEYNAQDVLLLEQIYLKLRPFISNHPNLTAILGGSEEICCPTCQSNLVIKRGFASTKTGRKQRFQCNECGSWSTGPYQRIPGILSGDDD